MSAIDLTRRFRSGLLLLGAMAMLGAAACSAEEAENRPLTDPEARAMLSRHFCNACHEVDEFRIGPAFRDVALRYGDSEEDKTGWLARKIIHGGSGNWGAVPMVSNDRISEEEAKRLADWILRLEPPAP